MIPNKKSSIILVLKILEEYSDEEHYLTQNDIASKILELYGIELERKGIASSLSLLEELDYDIDKGPKGGYALLSRTFDQTEATYLIDALFSSRSVDGKQAKHIADAISSCFSRYQRKDYKYIFKSAEINRTSNKEVLYNISVIQDAIKEGKRIGFKYLSYDENGNRTVRNNGFEYIVSPYYPINNFGRYYLLCNYREKYGALSVYRIDYMMDIAIKDDWPIKKMEDLKDAPKDFSISKYLNDHIYLFGGEVVDAELELENVLAIQYIKDWFGDNAKIRKKEDKISVKLRCDEEALYYWVIQYSEYVKVISPQSLVDKIKHGLKSALDKYND